MKLHISEGNMKLGRIPNISFPPIIACKKGIACAKLCYAVKAYRLYPEAKKAWDENFALWNADPDKFFGDLGAYLEKRKRPRFRFFVAGDVPNQDFVNRMAKLPKKTKYLLFTKQFDFNYDDLPNNFQVVYSTWPDCPLPTDFSRPWAWLSTDKRAPTTNPHLECENKCSDCGAKCWDKLTSTYHVVFDPH